MCQFLSSKASTKACRFHGMNTQLPLLQLSIGRELVATWQPNTPLLVSNLCFVVDLSSFNKPVLGTIVRALTGGIDRALHLTPTPRTGSTLAHCDFVLCLRLRDQAKDVQCVSSTCVPSQRTCFAIELLLICQDSSSPS